MTYIIEKPTNIKELDDFLSELYAGQSRPSTWKEDRQRLIELYELEDTDAE